MAKLSTTLTSLLGLAVCGAVIGALAAANGAPAPESAQRPAPTPAPVTTTVVPAPSSTRPAPATSQERVAPRQPSIAAVPVNRDPVNVAPPEDYHPPGVSPGDPGYRRLPSWYGYPPPAGTTSSEYYYSCLRQAHAHGSNKSSLTCQYLANTLPSG